MAYNLTAELFTELAIGMIIFGLRFYARWKLVGFRGFALDDLFAGFAVVSEAQISADSAPITNSTGPDILDS
jgi:hypothetical protein